MGGQGTGFRCLGCSGQTSGGFQPFLIGLLGRCLITLFGSRSRGGFLFGYYICYRFSCSTSFCCSVHLSRNVSYASECPRTHREASLSVPTCFEMTASIKCSLLCFPPR